MDQHIPGPLHFLRLTKYSFFFQFFVSGTCAFQPKKKDANHSLFIVSQDLRLSMKRPVVVCSPITDGLCKRTSMKKRQRDVHKSADLEGHTLDNLRALKKHRSQRRGGVHNVEASSFDRLTDELVLAILAALNNPRSLILWGQTSRRHRGLAGDPCLWRQLCESRFGPLLHRQFLELGKDWRWLYRAQAHVARMVGATSVQFLCAPASTTMCIGVIA
ncbi:Morn repeat protein [Pandoravirus inopinatum]|uniref:Morn repeat protein n=1 Tax=Pandoravirus inopinatum TaxID=1605721 RepID=A0A0B5JCK3_9VIRU|nr:Morn repeat protein [Pandoravirus inopinatum]AJF97367.1 Morn repeat protein [Pandoravirus inopinatum]